jgi:hypothetical protein
MLFGFTHLRQIQPAPRADPSISSPFVATARRNTGGTKGHVQNQALRWVTLGLSCG